MQRFTLDAPKIAAARGRIAAVGLAFRALGRGCGHAGGRTPAACAGADRRERGRAAHCGDAKQIAHPAVRPAVLERRRWVTGDRGRATDVGSGAVHPRQEGGDHQRFGVRSGHAADWGGRCGGYPRRRQSAGEDPR